MWDARWTALEALWNAILLNATTYWWFGPLVLLLAALASWRKIVRLGALVTRTFIHVHS
jgi:hypothetical protein